MDTQNYKKNIASYCEVVNAARVSRRLEFLAIELDRMLRDLAILVGESKLPDCTELFKSQIWSLALDADKKYADLFKEHVGLLNSKYES